MLCRRYPAYTPESARDADVSVLRHVQVLALAGELEPPAPRGEDGALAGMAGGMGLGTDADGFWD